MRAWILSDLHGRTVPIPDDADVAIIAGDVCNDEWLLEVAQKMDVVFVAGNHEFYNSTIGDTLNKYREWDNVDPGFTFLENNSAFYYSELHVAGATLWTDFNNDPRAANAARYGMNDHKYITWRKIPWQRFLPSHATNMHRESFEYLQGIGADIIVTHHAPHPGSVHPRYDGQLLNYAYFSNVLEKFDNPPKLWIHGHTHDVFDYMVGETRVICNPMGYSHERDNGFNPALILEI